MGHPTFLKHFRLVRERKREVQITTGGRDSIVKRLKRGTPDPAAGASSPPSARRAVGWGTPFFKDKAF